MRNGVIDGLIQFMSDIAEIEAGESWTFPFAASPTRAAAPPVTVVQLSDLHLGHDGQTHEEALELWCDWLDDRRPDFVVVTGDLSHHPEDTMSWAYAAEQLNRTGLRWAAIPGNHDIAKPYPAVSTFDERFGETPRVERIGAVELVLFDTFRRLPVSDRSDADRCRGERSGETFAHGAVTAEQMAEAERLLQPGRARIACIHHHLHEHRQERGKDEPTDVERERMRPIYDRESFLDWCAEHHVDLILSGHQHAWTPPEFFRGILNVRGTKSTRSTGVARLVELGDSIQIRDFSLPVRYEP